MNKLLSAPQTSLPRRDPAHSGQRRRSSVISIASSVISSGGVNVGSIVSCKLSHEQVASPRPVKERRSLFTPVGISGYKFTHVVGTGSTAKVKRAIGVSNREEVAIKVVRKRVGDPIACPEEYVKATQAKLQREVENLALVTGHTNVIGLRDYAETERKIFVVTDYVDGGDLFDFIRDHGPLKGQSLKTVCLQMVNAVKHMHQCGVAHRDLKPENILVDQDLNIKVCDFGMSVQWNKGSPLLPGTMGTVRCLPPEMIRRPHNTHPEHDPQAADIWSLGITCYYVATGYFPFEGETDVETLTNTVHRRLARPWPKQVTPSVQELICSMLRPKPKDRPSADAVIKHPCLFVRRGSQQL